MWKRAWKDTIPAIGVHNKGNTIRSILLVGVALLIVSYLGGQSQMREEFRWIISTIIAIGVVFAVTFLFNLVRAPVYIKWEKEKIANVIVKPRSGRRQWDYENPHLMWAELCITNTSPILPLKNVEVQIATCLDIVDIREGGRDAPVKHHLYDRGTWSRVSVLWSELDVSPPSTRIDIPPRATKIALLAFQDNSNGQWTIYNAPISPKPMSLGGAKIEVEVNGIDSTLWKGSYYIECHPNYIDGTLAKFEFIEWDKWATNRNIIPLELGKEGSHT